MPTEVVEALGKKTNTQIMSYDDKCHKHIKEVGGKTGNGRQMALYYCPMTLEADVPFTKAQCARQKDVQ